MQQCSVSKTVDRFNTALGDPIALLPVRSCGRLIAAIGRWHHHGARIDLATTRTTQLVLNMTSGQAIEQRSGSRFVRTRATAGDIAIVRPGFLPKVKISGDAGTLQVILSTDIVASAARGVSDQRIDELARRGQLQSLASQALVALPNPSGDETTLAALVADIALLVAVQAATVSALACGGL